MNLSFIDWLIIFSMIALMIWGVLYTKKLMQSVSDFLAAGRSAGRYVLSFASGMAQLGAISIIGLLEMNYIAGFTLRWWEYANAIVILIVTVSGWVVYRFRQTRALTLAQFFEMRYSKNFRIFAGFLSFIAGIINFGIFPAVGARFFIYFCGLPQYFTFLGLEISTFAFVMIMLLAISLFFVFVGGQISVIITDYIQGLFVNIVFVVMVIYLLTIVDWDTIYEALKMAPSDASLLNPFNTSKTEDFNFWYFFVGMVGIFYGKLSWQGHQGYYTSAATPHEARMGEVLSNWRTIPQWSLFIYVVPIIAYAVMNHPDFTAIFSSVQSTLGDVDGKAIQSQLKVPLVLTQMLPVGMMGAFAAIMLAAFVSTHDTYLHSWASIFIQDVYLPFTGKKLAPEKHLKTLKLAIFGVAVFIFIFSLLFQQSEYIFLFFAITGAIFLGGSGAVIIGGLYWKRGTTAAAWSALITGSVIAVGGIIIHQIWDDFFINGQIFWGLAMAGASVVYILVSLLGKKQEFNLDKMLHRGKYSIKEDTSLATKEEVKTGWRALGVGKEFTRGDKLIFIATYAWTFIWTFIFIAGTIYNLTTDVLDEQWMEFWKMFVYINIGISIIVIVWFGIGGMFDLKKMFARLSSMKRDTSDDGFVNEK